MNQELLNKFMEHWKQFLMVEQGANGVMNPQIKPCNGFCGEYECKENQDNCKRTKSNIKNVEHTTQKPLRTSKEIIKSIENELIRGKEIIKKGY